MGNGRGDRSRIVWAGTIVVRVGAVQAETKPRGEAGSMSRSVCVPILTYGHRGVGDGRTNQIWDAGGRGDAPRWMSQHGHTREASDRTVTSPDRQLQETS